jgi:hypothetical protein
MMEPPSRKPDAGRLQIRVELFPEPRPEKPRVVAIAGAIGRAPLVTDLDRDTWPESESAMLIFPCVTYPEIAAECLALARKALAIGASVVLFAGPHEARAAEAWLRRLEPEARRE